MGPLPGTQVCSIPVPPKKAGQKASGAAHLSSELQAQAPASREAKRGVGRDAYRARPLGLPQRVRRPQERERAPWLARGPIPEATTRTQQGRGRDHPTSMGPRRWRSVETLTQCQCAQMTPRVHRRTKDNGCRLATGPRQRQAMKMGCAPWTAVAARGRRRRPTAEGPGRQHRRWIPAAAAAAAAAAVPPEGLRNRQWAPQLPRPPQPSCQRQLTAARHLLRERKPCIWSAWKPGHAIW